MPTSEASREYLETNLEYQAEDSIFEWLWTEMPLAALWIWDYGLVWKQIRLLLQTGGTNLHQAGENLCENAGRKS